ncbi:MAG TPA: carboxypeptidase-like regulatory domain-containing protein, partial [Chitinophagaceae bacterium]
MRKLLFLPLAMLLLYGQLLAQTRTITGQIIDGLGNGVPNASVTVKGSTSGTTTNADGRFSLSIPQNARILVISSVGFQQKEMEIKNQSTINVSLTNTENALTEIVVTGYTRERKSQFAGAATVIGGSAVGNVPVGSFDQALQGRAPGLLVNSSSGQPGSSPAITIRGVQSIQGAGAQPLFILDGIPLAANDMQTL